MPPRWNGVKREYGNPGEAPQDLRGMLHGDYDAMSNAITHFTYLLVRQAESSSCRLAKSTSYRMVPVQAHSRNYDL